MPSLSSRPLGAPSLGDVLVLIDEQSESRVEVVPSRGALVTSFSVRGRELLYLDRDTLLDPTKNVRGGIPVLFPSPGKLAGDAYQYQGVQGAMKQHGFARLLPFRPSATRAEQASVTLTLEANDETRALFPWEFAFSLQLTLAGTRLSLGLRVHNPGVRSLPFALGFHPYFAVADKRRARIDTAATRAFDNVQKRDVPFAGFDLTQPEVDLHLLDHGGSESALHYGDGTRLALRASPAFTRWVIWTLADKPYVCVEPWSALGNALNTGADLCVLAPGATYEGHFDLELVS